MLHFQHEDYNDGTGAYANDIAVLRLEDDIVFNEFVKPAILASPEQDEDFVSSRCWATGWGKEGGFHCVVKYLVFKTNYLAEQSTEQIRTCHAYEKCIVLLKLYLLTLVLECYKTYGVN